MVRLCGFILFFSSALNAQWYSSWSYRKSITNNPAISGDLTNFPLLIVISNDSDLNVFASNNGHDILFTLTSSTNKLDHEIEYYSTGTMIAWVKMPLLSATETASNILHMYFDKSKSGSQQNVSNTWNNGFRAVWHMNESSGINISNSVTGQSGVKTGTANPAYEANGKISGCQSFAAGSDVINNPNDPAWILTNTDHTFEIWFKAPAQTVDYARLIDRYTGGGFGQGYFIYFRLTGTVSFEQRSENANYCRTTTTALYDDDVWHYMAATVSYISKNAVLYMNGWQEIKTDAYLGELIDYTNRPLYFGNNSGASADYIGQIDEVRLSAVARSSNWVTTSYSNQCSPTDFIKLGLRELYPGVLFSSITPLYSIGVAGENIAFQLNARLLTGIISSVSINWGDGQTSSYLPGVIDIAGESFSHIYLMRSNFTVTAASGFAATNSTTISTLPYRFYNPQYMSFSNDSKGCLIKWDIISSANIDHFNLYRGNDLQARIENPALREYLDECFIFGDRHTYWLEAVYPAGSIFSTTNTSDFHRVYRREALLGTGGGSLATLLAELYAPQNVLSASCTISMNIVSNTYASFYESGKPVYHQIELSSLDIADKIKGGMVLKFRIPAQAGALSFKPSDASGFTIAGHKDKLFCSFWNGKTWTALSTAVYEKRMQNNFSFLELETSVNKLGIYGIIYNPESTIQNDKPIVKNRLFVPGINDPLRSSVQISFPNPEREQVNIKVFNVNGKIVNEMEFYNWISFWSWNGSDKTGKIAESGLYIVTITIGGISNDAFNVHCYLLK